MLANNGSKFVQLKLEFSLSLLMQFFLFEFPRSKWLAFLIKVDCIERSV